MWKSTANGLITTNFILVWDIDTPGYEFSFNNEYLIVVWIFNIKKYNGCLFEMGMLGLAIVLLPISSSAPHTYNRLHRKLILLAYCFYFRSFLNLLNSEVCCYFYKVGLLLKDLSLGWNILTWTDQNFVRASS